MEILDTNRFGILEKKILEKFFNFKRFTYMDIVLMLFAMSQASPLFEPPKQPTAVVVEVSKLDTSTVDIHGDMLDPNWFEKK
jgi:hypothetical protein